MVIILRKMLLIAVRPPVAALTLLLPYPPKAGKEPKQPPSKFAAPKATSSRFGLKVIPCTPSLDFASPWDKLLEATDDSKKPRRAIRKDVPIASRICFMWSVWNGQWKANGDPVLDWTFPRTSRPLSSQQNFRVRMADRTTTVNRSGI